MICKVLECDNLVVDSRGLCTQHLRRSIDGLVYANDSGNLVDHCQRNHELIGDNVRWEAAGKKGKKRRRCRLCLQAKAQRQARNHAAVVEVPRPYRPNDSTLSNAIDDFEEAKKHVTAKCKDNPGPYMDYAEDDVPSEEEALALCFGCPLFKSCGNFAVAAQMRDGIWGGRVFG